MTNFLKSMQRIVGGFHAHGGKVGWRYRHDETFEDGLKLFIDFLLFQLQELGSHEQTSDLTLFNPYESLNAVARSDFSRFVLNTKHSISDILTEFGVLTETYGVDIATDQSASRSLSVALATIHHDIMIAFARLFDLTKQFERTAINAGLENDSVYLEAQRLLRATGQIGLDDLCKILVGGAAPNVFKLDPIDDQFSATVSPSNRPISPEK